MFKFKALYSRLLTQLKVYLKDYLYVFKTWELAVVVVMRVWQRKVNSCFYFRVKKIWQNEGGGLLEDVAHPSLSAGQAVFLRRHSGRVRHRRFNYSFSAGSNTWECSQCRGRQRARCALLVRSDHHHTPRHLRHLPGCLTAITHGLLPGDTVTGKLEAVLQRWIMACLKRILFRCVSMTL